MAVCNRQEVSAAYARDIARYSQVQRDTLLSAAVRFDVTVMAQGEVEEKKIVLGTEAQRDEALATLVASGWLRGRGDPLHALYSGVLFYSDVVADYDTVVRQQELVSGYRLHGNLVALANGIPSIYFTYDSRTQEFVETFAIPAHDIYSEKEFVLADYWDQARFERFNLTYSQRYRDMAAFLTESGVRHKMRAPRARSSPLAAAA